jgi:hypothetical protein
MLSISGDQSGLPALVFHDSRFDPTFGRSILSLC